MTEKLKVTIRDQPSTSAQDNIFIRYLDTSTDTNYPNTRYIYTKNFGDGSASMIYEGYDTLTNKKVIIKQIPKKECWRRELEILQKVASLNCKKLIKYVDFYESRYSSYIVTEFYDGYDLYEHIQINVPYTQRKALLIAREMALCIKECHDNNIIHLDIKCENYMVKNDKLFVDGIPYIVLIDFGHSEIIAENESIEKQRCGYNYGSKYYTCPEGYYERLYSSKSDMWSLGVCLFVLLTGEYPYKGRGRKKYYFNSLSNSINYNENIQIDEDVKLLLSDALNSEAKIRPSVDNFIERINVILTRMR